MMSSRRAGTSFIEVLAAIIIAATVAALGVQFLRPAGGTGQQRGCDLNREVLQLHTKRFIEATGQTPARDLRELQTTRYYGTELPPCPVTGQSYYLDRSGIVSCPTHEATRVK